jgi:hypothetical protein
MSLLATMFTITTYGTWLRGDARGWVDDGITLPPDPPLEARDRDRLVHPPFYFDAAVILEVGQSIGESLVGRMNLRVFALCVQSWHAHFVVGSTDQSPAAIVKCAKDAARWKLRIDRRIWCTGYDKRFCFDEPSVRARVAYVEKHNLRDGLPPRPWGFVSPA